MEQRKFRITADVNECGNRNFLFQVRKIVEVLRVCHSLILTQSHRYSLCFIKADTVYVIQVRKQLVLTSDAST